MPTIGFVQTGNCHKAPEQSGARAITAFAANFGRPSQSELVAIAEARARTQSGISSLRKNLARVKGW